VTVGQFARFQLETGRSAGEKAKPTRDSGSPDAAESLPVVRVTSQEAQDYARWAGKGLPTEAQWEMAARTPDGRQQPWGDGPIPGGKPFSYKKVDPVMSCPGDLSPYGVYDLAGNAWEWTADWFDSTYFQPMRDSVADNPVGPTRSRLKPPQYTIKGTSKIGQCSAREGMKADTRMAYLGFRCALPLEQTAGSVQVQTGGESPPAAPAPVPVPSSDPPPASSKGLVPF
jgi:sulfatase modifying factor 1